MDAKKLKAEKRTVFGRKISRLRTAGLLPGNISGKKIKSEAVQVEYKAFKEVYDEVGETGLVEIDLAGEKRPVLIHNMQVNPKTDAPVHVDFLQVDLKEKVEAQVPVEVTGESPAEKQAIGTVVQYVNEVKVEALPADLPEKIVVDTSVLAEVDQAIYIKDLQYDKAKVQIMNDPEEIVVKVEPPQKEEVVEAPVAAEGEVPAEGTAPAEGGATAETTNEAPKE